MGDDVWLVVSYLLPRGGTRYEGYAKTEEEAQGIIDVMKKSQKELNRGGLEEDSCIRVFALARLPKLGSGVVCHSYFDVTVRTSAQGTAYERKLFEINAETILAPTLKHEEKLYESLCTLRENPDESILVENKFDPGTNDTTERYLTFNPENVPFFDHPRVIFVVQ